MIDLRVTSRPQASLKTGVRRSSIAFSTWPRLLVAPIEGGQGLAGMRFWGRVTRCLNHGLISGTCVEGIIWTLGTTEKSTAEMPSLRLISRPDRASMELRGVRRCFPALAWAVSIIATLGGRQRKRSRRFLSVLICHRRRGLRWPPRAFPGLPQKIQGPYNSFSLLTSETRASGNRDAPLDPGRSPKSGIDDQHATRHGDHEGLCCQTMPPAAPSKAKPAAPGD
jgi:hypothetical protein